jgi:hypothetical protein
MARFFFHEFTTKFSPVDLRISYVIVHYSFVAPPFSCKGCWTTIAFALQDVLRRRNFFTQTVGKPRFVDVYVPALEYPSIPRLNLSV